MKTSNRVILEVLKFVSARDILTQVSVVSRKYYSLSEKDELWRSLLPEDAVATHPKQEYRKLFAAMVPVLRPEELLVFNVKSETWRRVPLSFTVEIDRFLSIVNLPDYTLFVTGAPDSRSNTFTVDPENGAVTFLPSLLTPRNCMGVIAFEGRVYAFGGSGGCKTAAEVFTSGQWQALPQTLNERYAFNPCEHARVIFLVGGCGTSDSEFYSVDSNQFAPLGFETSGQFCTVAVWRDGHILALQEESYYRYSPDTAHYETKRYGFDLGLAFWSCAELVEKSGEFFVLQEYSKRIVILNLQTLSHRLEKVPYEQE